MCVCVYVRICLYICMRVCVYVYEYICVCVCALARAFGLACLRVGAYELLLVESDLCVVRGPNPLRREHVFWLGDNNMFIT